MRASTLGNNVLAINREIDSRYDAVIAVRDKLPEIELVAGMDLDALIAELENAQDFTGITVVSGTEVAWDAVNKVLTVPRGEQGVKGDKGDKGDIGLQGPQGPRGAQGPQGLKGDIGPDGPRGLNGPKGDSGKDGKDGKDLTVTQIVYNSDGTFTWMFSDGTNYVTPNLKGDQGAAGDKGDKGDQGVSVHHMKGASTTDPEGDFSTAGELDTYTFYADADELSPLAWFTVKNGEDPWRRAVDRGYRGTEEEFYTLLGSVEEYATIALESINITEDNKQIVLAAAVQVAADKLIVEEAKDIAVEKSDIAKESADAVQIIFLGTKSVDPVVDNQGNPLVVGVMYYNEVIGQLKLWNGTEWTTAAFSAGGAVISFNGRNGAISLTNSDITIAVGRNVADALNTTDLAVASEVSKTNSHIADISNPHGVTKAQVGLGNVDNTEDSVKNVLSATKLTTARTINGVSFDGTSNIVVSDATKIPISEKGAVNGVATLGADGKIAASQLPSYVDDVLEYSSLSEFPVTGEKGKIYVALDTNKAYRWSGSTYVYITSGAVDSVAGKTGVVTLVKADVGLENVDNTSDANKPVSTAAQNALNLKANASNAVLTGVPIATTASVGTNTTQLATTAFVNAAITDSAPTKTGTGASGTWGISVSGNADTATKLATARTINGVSFDGTTNITIADNTKAEKSANLSDLANAAAARTNLGLGTAATRNVGTGNGNVLEFGAFGLGLRYPVGVVDANTLPEQYPYTGFVPLLTNIGSTNTPYTYVYIQQLMYYTNSRNLTQIAYGYNINRVWIRYRYSDSWSNWNQLISSETLLNTTGQSTVYPMTQKAVTDAINGISDERDKTEINEIGLGLEVIENLKTFSFKLNKRDWYRQKAAKELIEVEEDGKVTIQEKINDNVLNAPLSDFEENDGSLKRNDVYTGFVAQDLKETLVSLDLGHLGIVKNYTEEYEGGEDRFYIEHLALLPFLVNSVKQLSARVKTLEGRQSGEVE